MKARMSFCAAAGPKSRLNVTLTTIAVLLLIPIGNVDAGEERVPADQPSVWTHAAVNAVILDYTYTGSESERISETAQQLSLLIHRSVLYSIIKYGPIGATHIIKNGGKEHFQPHRVMNKILDLEPGAESVIKPGHALVLLWGRLYEEGDDIYVQSYIRFLRRGIDETITLPLSGGQSASLELVGKLPSQSFAFAPRRLSARELKMINEEFEKNAVIRSNPDENELGRPIDRHKLGNYAYSILEAREGWMKIAPFAAGEPGWIRTDVALGELDLRSFMPELHFVEAVAGYLRYQMALSGEQRYSSRSDYPAWIRNALNRFAPREAVSRRAAIPTSVGKVIRANLAILAKQSPTPETITRANRLYTEAAELIPYNADAQNLVVCSRMYRTNLEGWTKTAAEDLGNDLLRCLSLDPGNSSILANLESFYSLLESKPDPERLLPREILTSRLKAVKEVRAARGGER